MLYDLIKSLQVTKGTNNKLAMLQQNKDNSDLKSFLKAVYEPTFSYYMTELPEGAVYGNYEEGEVMMDLIADTAVALAKREYTGFAAKQFVNAQVRKMNKQTLELFQMLINRDVKAGIATTAINKTWPGHVTVVPYQRCVLPKDSNVAKWAWGQPGFFAYSDIKADGMYANVNVGTVTNSEGSALRAAITSRNGSVFPLGSYFDKIVADALAVAGNLYPGDTQLQGELLVKLNGVLMPREKGNGVLNSILQTGEHPGEGYEFIMAVWDAIPFSQAQAKVKYLVPLRERRAKLEQAMSAANGGLQMIKYKIVTTKKQAAEHLLEAWANGEEGTIDKHSEAIWLDGDNKDQVKGKLEFTVELMIVGFKAGDKNSKHKDSFGSLLCQSSEGLLEVGVTGMSDALRLELYTKRDYYTGKIVSVTANGIMYSQDGGKTKHSLFLPRLNEVRLDKSEADSFTRIVAIQEAAKAGEELQKAGA
jgi:DNA ligase-1